MLLASLIFASTTESITVGFGLLLTSPSSCARAALGNQVPGYTHHLPGRMSKTSVCEATELTSFSKFNSCFSPGYRKRFGAYESDHKTFPPSPPRPAPPPAPSLTRCRTTCSRLRPCFARMGCSASCRRLVGLAEILTTRSRLANSSLYGTFELRSGGDPGDPFSQNKPGGGQN